MPKPPNGWRATSAPVFERLMAAVGRPELVDDPRFATNHARIEHRATLDGILQAWFGERGRDEAIELLSASGAAVGPIYDVSELLSDPHVVARGSFETHHDPAASPSDGPNLVPLDQAETFLQRILQIRETVEAFGDDTIAT